LCSWALRADVDYEIRRQSVRSVRKAESMTHSRSLRVIGQRLELSKISQFQIEHDGEDYTVTSDLMSRTAQWILRYATTQDIFAPSGQQAAHTVLNLNPITFTQADLIRLDSWEARRRRELLEIQPPTKLSHLLRILGAQLDKNAARAFSIFWTPNSVVVDYKRAGGFTDRLRLSPATIGETISGGFHRGIVALPRRYV
jgi:hypothetical protein